MAKQTKKQAKKSVRNMIFLPLLLLVLIIGAYFILRTVLENRKQKPEWPVSENTPVQTTTDVSLTTTTTTETTLRFPAAPERTSETLTVDDATKVLAHNSALIECSANGGTLLAEHNADARIYPASMTKMMSLVTFVELVDESALEDVILMDAGVIAEQEAQMAYVAGFKADEACRIKDLMYAMMLPSGADAAVMLATYAAGSEAAFAEKMNALAAEMGLSQSHFVNCTGLHDEQHYSSISDISRILMYALKNPVCREVMSTLQYTTAATAEHPEGIKLISTTLSRMVGNELENLPDPLHVIGGKTGFTNPAGQCLATWAESASGKTYVCVVAGSTTFQPLDAVGDVLTLYELTGLPLSQVERIVPDEADLPLYEHY